MPELAHSDLKLNPMRWVQHTKTLALKLAEINNALEARESA
jgi:hypothetical protein